MTLSEGSVEKNGKMNSERDVLKSSREGDVDTIKVLLKDPSVSNDTWIGAMFEAAFAVDMSDCVRKEMLWALSERYAGCHNERQQICEEFYNLGCC